MIEFAVAEHDDPEFLALAQRIVNGAIAVLDVREIFLVQIDRWFDHKWLHWRSRREGELRVPTFTPNRVRSETHFVRDAENSSWMPSDLPRSLHIHQPGRSWLAQPLDRYSNHAAFVWYSGRSATNQAGSLMFYLSGAEGYSWYATLRKSNQWTIADEYQITRRELQAFEERGHQLELTHP